jgi:beta-lactam-binding protein with PASTA domain
MKKYLQYLKSKEGLKHLGYIASVYVGLGLLSWVFLWWYTDHGSFVTVPDLKHQPIETAVEALEDIDLEALVIDSIWNDTAQPGSVKDLIPPPGSTIKEGRQIFLTIFRKTPPMETINIKQGEYAQVAMVKLRNKGIPFDVVYAENNNFIGAVVGIRANGQELLGGKQIKRGTRVKLLVGTSGKSTVSIPDLYGMTYMEVKGLLDSLHLTPQFFFELPPVDGADSASFYLCTQEPPFSPGAVPVKSGSIIDLHFTKTLCPRDSTSHTP